MNILRDDDWIVHLDEETLLTEGSVSPVSVAIPPPFVCENIDSGVASLLSPRVDYLLGADCCSITGWLFWEDSREKRPHH